VHPMKPPWNIRRCALFGAVVGLLLQLLPQIHTPFRFLGLSEGDDFQRALGAVIQMAITVFGGAAIFALVGKARNRFID